MKTITKDLLAQKCKDYKDYLLTFNSTGVKRDLKRRLDQIQYDIYEHYCVDDEYPNDLEMGWITDDEEPSFWVNKPFAFKDCEAIPFADFIRLHPEVKQGKVIENLKQQIAIYESLVERYDNKSSAALCKLEIEIAKLEEGCSF